MCAGHLTKGFILIQIEGLIALNVFRAQQNKIPSLCMRSAFTINDLPECLGLLGQVVRIWARTDSPECVPKGHFARLNLPKMGSAVFASPPFNGDVGEFLQKDTFNQGVGD